MDSSEVRQYVTISVQILCGIVRGTGVIVRILNLYYFVMSMTLEKLDGGMTSSSLKIIKTLRIQCMAALYLAITFMDCECLRILISKFIRFGTAIWDCNEPIYSGALYLLALALADNALYGFSSSEEVFEQRIPEGQDELVLRWNEEAEDRCIARGITAEGASEDPLTKEAYHADFRKILNNAGYFLTATVHAMRRNLGAAVQGQSSFPSPN